MRNNNEPILKINNVIMPTVDEDGITVTPNKVWSKNTGRVASGRMVGDIIAVKRTVDAKWAELNESELNTIKNAIDAAAFFAVEYFDPKSNGVISLTCYAGDLTEPLSYITREHGVYKGVTISLVEQ